jgi:hypothetical protein
VPRAASGGTGAAAEMSWGAAEKTHSYDAVEMMRGEMMRVVRREAVETQDGGLAETG